ncbi:SEC12-like protein 2 [Nymphaea colorata]|uniref:SEC12-like protein 2 n=1 Tax=Nymphaea colorata TaxID=210225 RepID=UPI00129EFA10|nr:SEC12-like protein 2 [Nymphaea colorata]XP_031492336.1 SEC12-like protein 2 [Nymphaea colorata]
MARGRKPPPPCSQKYGKPIFSASWVPFHAIDFKEAKEEGGSEQKEEKEGGHAVSPPPLGYLILSGGGGDSRTGVKNSIFLSKFDFSSNSLSPPVDEFHTDGDLPYRTAVHPGGEGLICSFPKGCRWFEWDASKDAEAHKLGLKSSEKNLKELEDAGQQIALTFNLDGSMLASGGEDGHLRVFKWPSMEMIVDQPNAHECVKDLDFSPEGKLLVSLGDSGPCRIWDLTSSAAVASLSGDKGESFRFCRFSRVFDSKVLYMATKKGEHGCILTWDSGSWKRTTEKRIAQNPVSAFNISPDGKLLAIGTAEGDILIADTLSMQVQKKVKEAHLVFVTALEFSHDSRALVSASGDSSARVTLVENKKQNGLNIPVLIFMILLAIVMYFLKMNKVF